MSDDVTSFYVKISKRIQICDGRHFVEVEIENTLCYSINTENLNESTCFYLKSSRVHICFSDFSCVHIFCVGNCLKLVPESTRSRIF